MALPKRVTVFLVIIYIWSSYAENVPQRCDYNFMLPQDDFASSCQAIAEAKMAQMKKTINSMKQQVTVTN